MLKRMLFLIFILVAASSLTAPALAQANNADQFVGVWANEDPNTDGITRVEIRSDGLSLFVHMWGKCQPTDCDWGEIATPLSDADDGVLSLTWTPTYKVETQQLTVLSDGRLQVAGYVHFTDSSGRPDMNYTEYFVRMTAMGPPPVVGGGCISLEIPANGVWTSESWFNTGITVNWGNTFSITASGQVRPSPNYDIVVGPWGTYDVQSWQDSFSIRSDWGHGAVIGKVTAAGAPFFVGEGGDFVADANGEIYMGVNDTDPGNNSGTFYVTICLATQGMKPTAPSNLIAYADERGDVNIAWDDNSDNESGFIVERRISGESWGVLPGTYYEANRTIGTETGLQPGTTYEFRVYAFNDAGTSDYSNTVVVTTASGQSGPSVPSEPSAPSAPSAPSTAPPSSYYFTVSALETPGELAYLCAYNEYTISSQDYDATFNGSTLAITFRVRGADLCGNRDVTFTMYFGLSGGTIYTEGSVAATGVFDSSPFTNVYIDNLDNHVSGASLSSETTGWLPDGPGESGWISVPWINAWHTSAYTEQFMAAGAYWQASLVIPVRWGP